MTDAQPEVPMFQRLNQRELEFGGLRFDVYFTGTFGATMRVSGRVDGEWKEMLRFDDFVDTPHYHAPADDHQINYDRQNGDPLEWYIAQIRDDLDGWLTRSGFAEVIPTIDEAAVSANVGQLRDAMHDCLPDGFERVPGVGLRRVESTATA
ncbi:MAG TPA: hypothetical protein VGH66_16905 [Acidimicrobiales bacterium]|jgi:hypothetical protein